MSDMQSWLSRLKLAVAESNITELEILCNEFDNKLLESLNLDEKIQAQALLGTTLEILENKKKDVNNKIKNLGKTKKYFSL